MASGDLNDLKGQALAACKRRGHTMQPWITYDETNAVTSCFGCGMEVQVLTNPAPNEVDIGGEALALNCQG